jgi:hypothetical protein
MTSTLGIALREDMMDSNREVDKVSGSPPEIITSLIAGRERIAEYIA